MKNFLLGILLIFLLAVPALAAHSVALSCTLPSDWTVNSGINFYRGSTAGGQTTTPINAAPATTCALTDSNVQAGQTYYYTAIQVVGALQSGPSSEAKATVVPYPPSGLTAVAN